LAEITNPYRPGEPVTDPAMLFGRQDAADWIELQVKGGNQTLALSASPLIGKTSLVRHVAVLQSMNAINMVVSPVALSPAETNGSADEALKPTLNAVLDSVIDQLVPPLSHLRLIDLQTKADAAQAAATLRELFGQVSQHLQPGQHLLLYVDDLHKLVDDDMALVASFLTCFMPLLDECQQLHLIFVVNQAVLKRISHPLLDGAPTFNLGALPIDASINMVTLPVKDVLRFDYGVTKRIAEINSHHPYYLTLFCHTLLKRQVHDGWVNQRDFDATLAEILNSHIEPFARIWEQSDWAERAVLAGMAAIQGAHGPITSQEILRYLQRQSRAVVPEVVMDALHTLAERGVLVPMGAVSYRFHVELFRFWLREHTDPAEVLAQVNWHRAADRVKSRPKPDVLDPRPATRRTAPTTQPARRKSGLVWAVLIIVLLFCAFILASGAIVAGILDLPVAFLAQTTLTPTPTVTSSAEEVLPPADTGPASAASAEPISTATPTPPLVVARTLPSITYMGRDVDQNWLVYVMNADGSEVSRISSEDGDDTGPVWSPNGQKIAFVSLRDGNREIYVMDADGQNVANVTRHPADDWTPSWSPDGTRMAFSSFRDGSWEIYIMDAACLTQSETCPERLTQITGDGNGNLSPVWSPDGTRFAYNSKANGNWDIFTMSLDGTEIRQVTTSLENDLAPAWSPDGTQLAFESNRDGNVEIYVIEAGGGTARNVSNLSLADDHGPTWSPDGQQIIFYSNREGNWDIFVTTVDGQSLTNLTQTPTRDEQTPSWRP
jgi:TolB protein